jgi:hypothetical protein
MALKYLYVPSGYKAGTAYGVLPNDSTADFDNFERDTSATRTNKDGLIESMGSDVPRLDYTNVSCPTLLLEPARTNKSRYSESINNWNKNPNDGTVTIRTNDEVSPDGNMTADVFSVLTAFDGVYTPSITSISNTTYSCSSYVKHVSGSSKIRLGITAGFHSGTGSKYVRFDLSDGSVILDELGGVGEFKSVYVGNGWYRLMIENILVPVNEGGSSHFIVYSYEDGLTELAVWGGQVEIGSYASSYVPNLSNGETTKNKDRAGWAANFSGMNSNEGVLEARFKAFPTTVSRRITLGTNVNGDNHNRITIGYAINGGVIKPFVLMAYDGGGTEESENQSVNMPSSFNIFEYNTYKFKFKAGNNELKINGELVALGSTVGNLDFSFSRELESISLNLFGGNTSNEFFGGIQHIKVYDSVTDF